MSPYSEDATPTTTVVRLFRVHPTVFYAMAALSMMALIAAPIVRAVRSSYDPPQTPAATCRDEVEIVSVSESARKCVAGTHLDTTRLGDGKVLVQCLCAQSTSDASVQP